MGGPTDHAPEGPGLKGAGESLPIPGVYRPRPLRTDATAIAPITIPDAPATEASADGLPEPEREAFVG